MSEHDRNRVDASHTPAPSRSWLTPWLLAGMIGFGVGGPLGVKLGTPGHAIENGYLSIALAYILTALLQWPIIRRRFGGAGGWMPAGLIGAAVGGAVVFGARPLDADVAFVAGSLLVPVVGAALQWRFVLHRHAGRGGGWWVAAAIGGWLAGGILGAGVIGGALGLEDKEGGLAAAVVWSVFGLVFSAVTGAVLLRLTRRRTELSPEGGMRA